MLLNGLQNPQSGGLLNEVTDEFSSVRLRTNSVHQSANLSSIQQKDIKRLRHHIMDSFGRWTPSHVAPQDKVDLIVRISDSAPTQLQLPTLHHTNSTKVSALADFGAQMCVADWQIAKNMGLRRKDLLIPALSISVADNSNLELIGAHFLTISAPTGHISNQLVYFATGVNQFYLSKSAMMDLSIIPHNFPKVKSCDANVKQIKSSTEKSNSDENFHEVTDEFTSVLHRANTASIHHITPNKDNHNSRSQENVTCTDVGPDWEHEQPEGLPQSRSWPLPPDLAAASAKVRKFDDKGRELAECGCLKRTPPPPPPEQPPCEMSPQNVPCIEKWLLDFYAASAFNTCAH